MCVCVYGLWIWADGGREREVEQNNWHHIGTNAMGWTVASRGPCCPEGPWGTAVITITVANLNRRLSSWLETNFI